MAEAIRVTGVGGVRQTDFVQHSFWRGGTFLALKSALAQPPFSAPPIAHMIIARPLKRDQTIGCSCAETLSHCRLFPLPGEIAGAAMAAGLARQVAQLPAAAEVVVNRIERVGIPARVIIRRVGRDGRGCNPRGGGVVKAGWH
jgi:hypothetical protein